MKVVGLIIVFSALVLFEVPQLWKKKMWGELIVFAGLMAVGMAMSFAALFYVNLFNPTPVIDLIFGPLSEAVTSLLE